MALSDPLRTHLEGLLARHPVVLFMKGTRQAPRCGFSASVVAILDGLLDDYETVDVLSSPELREGIKEFSAWPTIPQLYVRGAFVGGADIVRELEQSGSLAGLLGSEGGSVPLPSVALSPAAAEAFRAALREAGSEVLRLRIEPSFDNDLYLGATEPGDVVVTSEGITLHLDRASARRANGLRIDFVEGPAGGFRLDNPNEPPKVRELSAPELKDLLEHGGITLFDVRPEAERRLASIGGAHALDAEGQAYLRSLERSTPIGFYCHHGVRSRHAAEQALGAGFSRVYNLRGGIDAWSSSVDPAVPRY